MIRLIDKLYSKKVSGLGISVFRIAYGIILLCEIIQLYWFRHLVYDKIPYIYPAEIDFGIPLKIWGVTVIFLILGLFTKYVKIINYLLSLILIGSINTYEYHMFYVYMGVNFLILFMPVSRNLSIDRLFVKYKYSNTRFNYNPPTEVSVLNYYLIPLVAIAFVYFDSVFFKLTSRYWSIGLGLWYPSSIPITGKSNLSWILNIEILVKTLGYITVIFETVFLFTFFRKKWRIPLLITGLGLHLGILIAYPIPWFAIGMCTLYLLMIPVSFWDKIFSLFRKKEPKMVFYYDAECPLCNRTKITIQHFDIQDSVDFKAVQYYAKKEPLLKEYSEDELLDNIFSTKNGKVYQGLDTYIQVLNAIFYLKPFSWLLRIPGIYHIGKIVYSFIAKNRNTERCTEDNCGYEIPVLPSKPEKIKILKNYTLKDLQVFGISLGLALLTMTQIVISYNSPLVRIIREKIYFQNTIVNKKMEKFSSNVEQKTRVLFGLTVHGVFMDGHFSEYNHNLAVVFLDRQGKEQWLPITEKSGMPGTYLLGFNWVKWAFRVNSNRIEQKNLKTGIRDFTAFWAKKNGVDLKDATFIIKMQKLDTPKDWEHNFLEKQIQKPWQNIGEVKWSNYEYHISIPEVEKL